MAGPASPKAVRPRRAIVGACLGNAVEWYDFAIYGAFSTILATVFFPSGSRMALAATFAIFASSFIARPAGALVVGRRSDGFGRRRSLSHMIVMMTVATAAIGLLPTWSTIGILAPILLLLLRLAQGFSAGGEVSSSVAFVIESAPDGRRGWYGGWHMASIAVGLAAGFGVAALFAAVLHDDALTGWGWRVAFLTAAPLGLIARYIRRRLDETQAFESVLAPTMPRLVGDVLRGRGTRISRGFVLVAALGLTFNIWFVFLPSHLAASGAVPLRQALGFAVVGLFAAAGAAPVMGRLSDHFGRRPVLIASTSAIAASTVPGFMLASHSVPGRLVSFVGMGVLVGTLTVTAFVAEIFPTPVRATGVALTYGIATAVFGGTAPVMATLFTTIGATWLVPGFVTVMALIALAAAVTAEETAFDGLG